jgi:hypothetical protein
VTDDTKALAGLIEPEAIAARPDWDGQIRLSQAISFKRIADALESVIDHAFDKPSIRTRED